MMAAYFNYGSVLFHAEALRSLASSGGLHFFSEPLSEAAILFISFGLFNFPLLLPGYFQFSSKLATRRLPRNVRVLS
jgi:hypothetical protein